jgi:tetratricopeptide (TPR) repeat protein
MKFLELILVFFGFLGITFGVLMVYTLATLKKKKKYLQDMKEELERIKADLPDILLERLAPERKTASLEEFIKEKGENIDSLIERLRKAEFWSPPEVFYWIGLYYMAIEEHDKSIENLTKALNLKTEEKAIHFALGVAYTAKKEFGDAIHHLEQSIKKGEGMEAEANYNIGWIYDEEEKYDEAVKFYDRSLEKKKDTDTLYNKACALAKGGREDDSLGVLDEIKNEEDIKEWVRKDPDLENMRTSGKLNALLEG